MSTVNPTRQAAYKKRPEQRSNPRWRQLRHYLVFNLKIRASWLSLLGVLLIAVLLMLWALAPGRFPVAKIQIKAIQDGKAVHLRYGTAEQLNPMLQAFCVQGLLHVDSDSLATALEQFSWIDHAKVSRQWPDSLSVALQEPDVVAVWQDLNTDNPLLLTENAETVNLPELMGAIADKLPRLSGPKGTENLVLQLYRSSQQALAVIHLQISALHLNQRYAAEAVLDNRVLLLLSDIEPQRSLQRFILFYRQLSQEQWANVQSVDLRYAQGLVVR